MRRVLLLCVAGSITALQSPARTWHDIKWTPTSMRYYATRPPKDAPANNQTTFVKCVRHFLVKRRRALLYIAYFALGVAPAKAVHHDKWTALRQKPADLGGIRTRRRRAQAISQFAGIGYSPRVVALAGLMLRALVKCFRAPLEPSIGFGVGTKRKKLADFPQRKSDLLCLAHKSDAGNRLSVIFPSPSAAGLGWLFD